MNIWFNALERGTRTENTVRHSIKPAESAVPDVKVEVTPAGSNGAGAESKKNREHSIEKKEVKPLISCTCTMYVLVRFTSVFL